MADPRSGDGEQIECILRLDFQNTRPVDLIDLAESFHGVGTHFASYAWSKEVGVRKNNIRLNVVRMTEGSIVADLQVLVEQASFLIENADVLAGFVTNLDHLVQFFSGKSETDVPPSVSKPEAQRVASIMNPVASDDGAQINISVVGDNAKILVSNSYDSKDARAVTDGVRRYLEQSDLPAEDQFEDATLHFQRIDRPVKSEMDKGIIEAFCPKPRKLHYATPDVKEQIIDMEGNPLQHGFIVDGKVHRIGERVQAYTIYKIKDSFMIEE